MLLKRCPRVDELEALAQETVTLNQEFSPIASRRRQAPKLQRGLTPKMARVRRHVESCDTCSRVVAALKEDAALLDDLRLAHGDELAPATRARLLERCADALASESTGRLDAGPDHA